MSVHSNYQPEIQGLRAVAVLLVVYYHSGLNGLSGGYIGVDIFFVISGYLITGLLLRELERTKTISLTQFYSRRIRRLFPAASVVLIATVISAWFTYSPLELKQFSLSAFATATYISNGWFAYLATDYLAEDTFSNPLLHTWSLAVEEQFYLIWPLFLILVLRLGSLDRLTKRLIFGFSLVIFLSLSMSIWMTSYNQPWAFFGSPTRAWEFGAGGSLAIWMKSSERINNKIAILLGLVGLGVILVTAVLYTRKTSFPGTAAILPVIGTVFIIAAAHTKKIQGISVILATRPMQFIGDISYSLYLWHWPVFVFSALWFGKLGDIERILSIVLVFILAWLTMIFIENPVRFNRYLSSNFTSSYALSLILLSTTAGTSVVVRELAGTNLEQPLQKIFSVAEKSIPSIYNNGCHADFLDIDFPECQFGNENGEKIIVLFGDSHAAQWFPALEYLAKKENWQFYSFTKSGCPSIIYEPFDYQLGRQYTECTEWKEETLKRIRQLKPWLTLVTNLSRPIVETDNKKSNSTWYKATNELLALLVPISKHVIMLRDTPRPSMSAPICLSRGQWLGLDLSEECNIPSVPIWKQSVFNVEKEIANNFQNVNMIDLNSAICNEFPCSVMQNGIVLFRDSSHITTQYSIILAPKLLKVINSLESESNNLNNNNKTPII